MKREPASEAPAAVVLAAGAGTRLRPLTDLRPKAMCPVGNVPLVDLAIERAARASSSIAVNVHHGRAMLEPHLRGRVHLSIEEPRALGTAGAIRNLRDWIDGRAALVVNADAWTPDLDAAARLLDGWDGERVRLLVTDDPQRGDFGRWRFAGASLMPWSAVRGLEPEPPGLYEACWRDAIANERAELIAFDGPFIDCGTAADYHRANMVASAGNNVVAPDAVVHGTIERTVVWPGAVVARDEHLRDCIRARADVTVQV